MRKQKYINELKQNIEIKRDELNRLMCAEIDRDKLLKHSMELDKLIFKYYQFEKCSKKEARM